MSKNHHTMFRRLTTTTLSFIRNNSRSNTPTLYFCPFSLSPQPWWSISHHRSRWRFRHTSNFHPLQSSNLQNTWQPRLSSMPMRFFLPFQSQLSVSLVFSSSLTVEGSLSLISFFSIWATHSLTPRSPSHSCWKNKYVNGVPLFLHIIKT